MADRHTLEELNNCSREELITIVLMTVSYTHLINMTYSCRVELGMIYMECKKR